MTEISENDLTLAPNRSLALYLTVIPNEIRLAVRLTNCVLYFGFRMRSVELRKNRRRRLLHRQTDKVNLPAAPKAARKSVEKYGVFFLTTTAYSVSVFFLPKVVLHRSHFSFFWSGAWELCRRRRRHKAPFVLNLHSEGFLTSSQQQPEDYKKLDWGSWCRRLDSG